MSSGSSGQPSTSPAAGGKSVPANLVEGSGLSQNAEGIIFPKITRVPVSEGIISPKLARVPVSEGIIFPKLPRVQGIPIFKKLYLEKR